MEDDDVEKVKLYPSVSADMINDAYDDLINIVRQASDVAVTRCTKNFFKYWWDDRMKDIKERSVISCRIWKEADMYRKD